MELKITSNSAVFTKNLGKNFSKIISNGDVILFSGELGGGKTTFISGLAEGLGIRENVSSPSFTILNVYSTHRKNKLVHADFYRLENIEDIAEIGVEDYLYDNRAVVCMEWGDKIKKYIDRDCLEVEIRYLLADDENDSLNNSDRRLVTFKSFSQYWDNKLTKFMARFKYDEYFRD